MRKCGRLLGKSHTTVVRELERNPKGEYEPLQAQALFEARKKRAWERKHPLKNKRVFGYVIDHLRSGWSPEQISGRLREVDHRGEIGWQICPETIYQFIYGTHPVAKKLKLWEYLRRKQKRRHKKGGRSVHNLKIPDRISIHNMRESPV